MRLRTRLIPAVAAISLLAAACDTGDDPTDDPTPDETEVEETEDAVDDEDAVTDDDATDEDATDEDATEDDADEVDAPADGEASAAGLAVADGELGEHLVDDAGNTVYVNVEHAPGEAACVADCAQVWPPVTVDGEPSLDDGVDPDLVSTIELEDGTTQLAYDGRALHTFVGDQTGQAAGQGLALAWFVVAPDGTPIGAEDVATDAEDADEDDTDDTDDE